MKKSLLDTNPHLKDPAARTKALARNVVTSSAVEGINVVRNASNGRFVSCAKPKTSVTKQPKTSR